MKKCKHCQGEIDDKAKVCMHCKKEQTSNFSAFLLVIVIIVIIFGLIYVFGKTVNNLVNTNENNIYIIENNQQIVKDIYSINDVIYYEDIEFSVTNIQEKTNKQDSSINKGSKLIAVTYRVKNKGEDEKRFYGNDFIVISSNGEVIKPLLGVVLDMWKGEFFKGVDLVSGGTKEGYFVYKIKENDNNYTIRYKCGIDFFFNEINIDVEAK